MTILNFLAALVFLCKRVSSHLWLPIPVPIAQVTLSGQPPSLLLCHSPIHPEGPVPALSSPRGLGRYSCRSPHRGQALHVHFLHPCYFTSSVLVYPVSSLISEPLKRHPSAFMFTFFHSYLNSRPTKDGDLGSSYLLVCFRGLKSGMQSVRHKHVQGMEDWSSHTVWRKASKTPPANLANLQNTFHYCNKVLIKVIKYKQLDNGSKRK